ncbi:hypothetical protein Tco_0618874 [Tanacetum coccineum]
MRRALRYWFTHWRSRGRPDLGVLLLYKAFSVRDGGCVELGSSVFSLYKHALDHLLEMSCRFKSVHGGDGSTAGDGGGTDGGGSGEGILGLLRVDDGKDDCGGKDDDGKSDGGGEDKDGKRWWW